MRIPAVGLFVSHLVCVCGWVFFVWVFHTLLFISFHICLHLYSRLQSHADDTYSSVSQVARVAIAKYLETLAEEEARRDSGE